MGRFLETRRILVPIDFSESGRAILEYAVELARDRGAEVVLFHVVAVPVAPYDPAYGVASGPTVIREMQAAAEKALAALAAGAKPGPGVKLSTKVACGTPFREIVREAREGGHDLVVIGTHGRTGLRHVFLGSVAENVVRLAPCPVLTVRLKGFEIEKV